MNKKNLNVSKGTKLNPLSTDTNNMIMDNDKPEDLVENLEVMQESIQNAEIISKIKDPRKKIIDSSKLTIPRRLDKSKGPIKYPNKQTSITHLINNNENMLSRMKFISDADKNILPEKQNRVPSSANSCAEPDSSSESAYSQSDKSIKSAVTDTYLTNKDKLDTASREKLSQYLLEKNFGTEPRKDKRMEIIFKSKDIIHNFLNSMQYLQKAVINRNDNVEKIKRDFEVSKGKLSELVSELKGVIDIEFSETSRNRELSLASKDSFSKKSEQEVEAEKAEQQLHEIEERLKEEYKRVSKDSQSWKEKQKQFLDIDKDFPENERIQKMENENEDFKRKIGEVEDAIQTQKHTIQKLNERNEKQEKMINEYKEIVSKYEKKVRELQKNAIKTKRNQPSKILIGEEIKRKMETLISKQFLGIKTRFENWVEEYSEKLTKNRNSLYIAFDVLRKKSIENNELSINLNEIANLLRISKDNTVQNELALKAKSNIIEEMQKTLKKNLNENASLRLNLSREEEEKQNLINALREKNNKFLMICGKQIKFAQEKAIVLYAKLESCIKSVNLVKLAKMENEERSKTASIEQARSIQEKIKDLNAQIEKTKEEINAVKKELSNKLEQNADLTKKLDVKASQSKKFEELIKIKQADLAKCKMLLSRNLTSIVDVTVKSLNEKIQFAPFYVQLHNTYENCKKTLQEKNKKINELNEQIKNFNIEKQIKESKLVEMQKIIQNTESKLQIEIKNNLAKIADCKEVMKNTFSLIIEKMTKNSNEIINNNLFQSRLVAITELLKISLLDKNNKINDLNQRIYKLDLEKQSNEQEFLKMKNLFKDKEINLNKQHESEINTIKSEMQNYLRKIENTFKMQKEKAEGLVKRVLNKLQEETIKVLLCKIESSFSKFTNLNCILKELKNKSIQKEKNIEIEYKNMNNRILEKEVLNQNLIKENKKLIDEGKELKERLFECSQNISRNKNIQESIKKSLNQCIDNQRYASEALQNKINSGFNAQIMLIKKVEGLLSATKKLKEEQNILCKSNIILSEEINNNKQKQQKAYNSITQFKLFIYELFETNNKNQEKSMDKLSDKLSNLGSISKKVNSILDKKEEIIQKFNLSISESKSEMIKKNIQQHKLIDEIIKKCNEIGEQKIYSSIVINLNKQKEKLQNLSMSINKLKEKTEAKKENTRKAFNITKRLCKEKFGNAIKNCEEKKDELSIKIGLFNKKIETKKLELAEKINEQRKCIDNNWNMKIQKNHIVKEIIKKFHEANQSFYSIHVENMRIQYEKLHNLTKVFNEAKQKILFKKCTISKVKKESLEKTKDIIQNIERKKEEVDEKYKLLNMKISGLSKIIGKVFIIQESRHVDKFHTNHIQQQKIIGDIIKNCSEFNQNLFSSVFDIVGKQTIKVKNLSIAFKGLKEKIVSQKINNTKFINQLKKDNSEKIIQRFEANKIEMEEKAKLFNHRIMGISKDFEKVLAMQKQTLEYKFYTKQANIRSKMEGITQIYKELYLNLHSRFLNTFGNQNKKIILMENVIKGLKEKILSKKEYRTKFLIQLKSDNTKQADSINQSIDQHKKAVEEQCTLFNAKIKELSNTLGKVITKQAHTHEFKFYTKQVQQSKIIEGIMKNHHDWNQKIFSCICNNSGKQNLKIESLENVFRELKEKILTQKEFRSKVFNELKEKCSKKEEIFVQNTEIFKAETEEKCKSFNLKIIELKNILATKVRALEYKHKAEQIQQHKTIEGIMKNYNDSNKRILTSLINNLEKQNTKVQNMQSVFNGIKEKIIAKKVIRTKMMFDIKKDSSNRIKEYNISVENIKTDIEERCKLFKLKLLELNNTFGKVIVIKSRAQELKFCTQQLHIRKISESQVEKYLISNQVFFSSVIDKFGNHGEKLKDLENAVKLLKEKLQNRRINIKTVLDQLKKHNAKRMEIVKSNIENIKKDIEAKCKLFNCTISNYTNMFSQICNKQRETLKKVTHINIKQRDIINRYDENIHNLYTFAVNNLNSQKGKIINLGKAINRLKENIKNNNEKCINKNNQLKIVTTKRTEKVIQEIKVKNEEYEKKFQLFNKTITEINFKFSQSFSKQRSNYKKMLNNEKERAKLLENKLENAQSEIRSKNIILNEKDDIIKSTNEKIRSIIIIYQSSLSKLIPHFDISKMSLLFFMRLNELNQKVGTANKFLKQNQELLALKIVEAKNSKANLKEIQSYMIQLEKKDQMLAEIKNIADQESKKLNQEKAKVKRKLNDFKEIVNSSLLQWCNSVGTKVNVVSSQLTIYGARLRRAVTKRNMLIKKYKSKVIECKEKETFIAAIRNKDKNKLNCIIEQIYNLDVYNNITEKKCLYSNNWLEQINKLKEFEEIIINNCRRHVLKINSCVKKAHNYYIKKYSSCSISPMVYPMIIINTTKKEIEPKAKLKYLVKQIAEQIPLEY